ncbi:MAG: hypothetical protein J0L62_16435 [Bacteroidetes bacterium]|nr:hypothetical protein [Bacteroidota bacterium]
MRSIYPKPKLQKNGWVVVPNSRKAEFNAAGKSLYFPVLNVTGFSPRIKFS